MGLGSARVVSLAEARAKANECRKLLAAGIDPLDPPQRRTHGRPRRRTAHRDLQAMPRRLPDQPRRQVAAKHLRQWRNSMATYCKPLMDVAVGDIDVAMVLKVIEPEWKRAPATMDRVRRRIGEVLGWAEARGLRTPGPLPTRWKNHLDKLLPHPRSAEAGRPSCGAGLRRGAGPVSQADRHRRDPRAVPRLHDPDRDALSQEARGARWDEIDLKAGIWTVPPERMKRKREHRVPLSAEAMKLIERLPRNGEYLFTVNGNGKPIVAMSLRKALSRHGGDGFTVHGFRVGFRDWGGERTNAPRELLEVALAHAIGDPTERPMRAATCWRSGAG